MKIYHAFYLVPVSIFVIAFCVPPAYAAPYPQADDPMQQCAEGNELFLQDKYREALPLLEAGFNGREKANFTSSEDLGYCALALGILRRSAGNPNGALEAFQLALTIFRANQNRILEGITLDNLGYVFYSSQGQYAQAPDYFQQALAIWREVGDQAREGTTLHNLGYVYSSLGRYEQALDYYQQALSIAREVGDQEGEGATLNNIGLVYSYQDQYAQALEYFQHALVIRREVGDREGEGHTLTGIGYVYASQNQYAQALEYYQQALSIAREVGDRGGEGTALYYLGGVYSSQGQYAQALEYFQQALAIRREVGDREDEGNTLTGIGNVYYAQGRYAQALEYHQQALAIRREVGDREGEGNTLTGIGNVYDAQGRYAQALEYHQRALAIAQEVGDRGNEGAALNNLGSVSDHQGQYEQALNYYQHALVIAREVGNGEWEGAALDNLGRVYSSQGQYEHALDYFQQALSIRQEVGDWPGEGTTLNSLGYVYESQGQYAHALDYYQQSLVIEREVGDRAGEGVTLNNLGYVYDSQGQYAQALEYYQQALAIRREVGDREGEGGTLNNISLVYLGLGKYTQALDYFQQAITVFEELRAIAGNDTARTSFIAQHATVYQYATLAAHQLQQDDQAFAFSEQGRARSFLDALTTGALELSDQPAAELITHEQETYAGWRAAQEALAKAKAQNPPDTALINDLEAQLTNAEQAHTEALQAIEARGDELAALVPGRSTVLSLSEIQALLDDQTTLVSYFVIDDDSGALAFIITRDSFSVVELSNATPIKLKTAVEGILPSLQDTHPQPLQDLYAWLIAPIKDQLKTPRVGIIPHLTLHYVPFAALTDGQTYFGEQYQLFELPSASSLRYIQLHAAQATNSSAVIFGNPATNETGLAILPYAAAEANAVATTLGVSNFTGSTATELQLRESVSGKAILHLAAHGEYNQYNPLYSALYLAPDTDGKYDGRLEVHEIFGLNLRGSQLVVLSACETQLGQLSTGDEVVGMTRAFMFAGTPSVLASLWRVDDEATQTLMTAFYKHWRENGMNKAQALQAAQADVRANPKWQSPYYWAAFVLSGDVQTSPTKTTTIPSIPEDSWLINLAPTAGRRMLLLICLCCGLGVFSLLLLVGGRVLRHRGNSE